MPTSKPAIGRVLLEPWRTRIAELAECPNVWCKLSGLLTEADPARWRPGNFNLRSKRNGGS